MRKFLLAVALVSVMAAVGASTASAASRSGSVAGIGRYGCDNLSTTAHYIYYNCTVGDTGCDGHDVYLQYRLYTSAGTTDWARLTPSVTGGCGSSRWMTGNKWQATTINYGQVRICQNDVGWDTCGGMSASFQ